MSAYRVVAIDSQGYRPHAAMPADTTEQAALRELIRASAARRCCVVLRDGSTGRRTTVARAMDALGLTWIEKWNAAAWLARTEVAA